MKRGRPRHDDILTPREWEVLDLIREGLTNEQIAVRLEISANTAKFHVAEILAKLGVGSREEAARWNPASARSAWSFFRPAALLKFSAVAGALAAAGVAVAVLAIALSGPADAPPALGPLGKVAYVGADGNIWVKGLPDGKPVRLTDLGHSFSPAWSSDGEGLVFLRQVAAGGARPKLEAWFVRADGSDLHELPSMGSFAWPPSGDHVYYRLDDHVVMAEKPDGSGRREILRLEQGPGEEARLRWFQLAPDGTGYSYVVESWAAGEEPPGNAAGGKSRLTLWSSVGADAPAQLLLDLGEAELYRQLMHWYTPDGRRLLFTSWDTSLVDREALGRLPLLSVPVGGGEVVDTGLTFPLLTLSPDGHSNPPSGRLLLVGGSGEALWTNKAIYSFDSGTGLVQRLTPPEIAAVGPALSPDGTRIAYVSAPDLGLSGRDVALASRRIWVMGADGSNRVQVSSDGEHRDERPIWSGDGRTLLFARLPADACGASSFDLMMLDLESGAESILIEDLPILGVDNWWPRVVGEVPDCQTGDAGPLSDNMGNFHLRSVLDWWQP